ncbi:hypothetical protein A2313_00015 [Candidatus Roizmanbacteria bacterium RIFOXYB2_FULL_41_10]|uniref:Uncharacterized protein n=1 Tax=Candidatus Roizmanbacteria bacterium RIFOXYA1_FULL_41_12 TaxID=1802082 RepID=A0A1F7KFN4_9BACT|nr:MAG: hypothetical protein A2209_00090 [Candidatus Roizmanbacteria bacterium RIFOXYA1_FULL_41_12]OGK67642.1 MAG: hypothetical protein A2377_00725 [Candidatus Roizmanbacteria bacterium RIFOXYB1_FULL_41_27]OGK67896.1 MAG: hypothetical protein A2262_00705 [Candidatus Roizmanbacteria bacterium RIFOXYA2_FULL_41_8]OGK69351.1 MAG: hypothetical protein A2313_00015 [Candidatus Roizmanbacteria bacterium RIFOXYB2_FULL_41_10]OGK71364.1 MAG: hypothetical protein A2403_01110 [Candidatus Roizmanbacteria bac
MNQKKLIILSVIFVILLIVGVGWLVAKKGGTKEEVGESTLPVGQRYEKVEPGIEVTVERVKDGRRVDFQVSQIPAKYETIEYEFSYKTGSGGLQGGIGSPSVIKKGAYQKEILLGTCSAGGACTYDEGVEKIKFTIFFNTGSQKRYFEKEFTI